MFKLKLLVFITVFMFFLPVCGLADVQEKPAVKKVLSNGMTVVFQDGAGEPASVFLFVKVGPAYESNENYGITNLLNHVLLSVDPLGTANPPSLRLEQAGAVAGVVTAADYSCFRLSVPSKNLPSAIKALGEIFAFRGLTEASLSREKESITSARLREEDRLDEAVYRSYLGNTLDGSRYLVMTEGKPDVSSRLGTSQLIDWYTANYQPGNMIISVCGKLNASSVFKMAEASFKGTGGNRPSRRLTAMPASVSGNLELTSPPGLSAGLIVYEAPPVGSGDQAAAAVAEALLSRGMCSIMFRKLRGDSVSAYEFGSFMPAMLGSSRLALYTITDEGRGGQSMSALRSCVEDLKTGTFGIEDLVRAKSAVLGSITVKRESNLGKAWEAGFDETMNLGQEHGALYARQVEKIDKAEIVKVSGKYFDRRFEVVASPMKKTY